MIYALGPRAQRVYAALREQILGGAFPQARLPSHTALAATFGVAPLTLRQVLSRLEDEGLVSRQQGRGTFILVPAPPAPTPTEVEDAPPLAWLEQMDDIAIVFDATGCVRVWNPRATEELGTPRDTGQGRRADHVYPAYMWQRWQRALPARPLPQDWRWQGPDRNGATLWLDGRLYPLRDAAGQLDGILCLGRNVTAYKQQEHAQAAATPPSTPPSQVLDLHVGVLVLGPQAVILHSNPVACDFLGLAHAEIQGKSLAQLPIHVIYEDSVPMMGSGGPIAQALISGRPVHNIVMGIWRSTTADRIWLLLNADPELAPDGVTMHVVCTGIDITERRRAQETLQQRDREFKALVENAPDLIVRFDRQLRHTYVNPALGAATGQPPDNFIGKTPAEAGLPPAVAALWADTVTQVFNTGQEIEIEFALPTPGGRRHYQARLAPEFEPDGAIAAVLAIAHDITARKHAEERFATVFHASPHGIAVSRLRDERILDVNESWLQIMGYRRDEVIDHTPNELDLWATKDDRERIRDLMIRDRALHNQEFAFRRKSGEVRQGIFSVERIDIDGEVCLLALCVDVTEREQAAAAVAQLAVIVESSDDAIIGKTLDGIIVSWNQGAEHIFGYTAAETVGRAIDLLVPPETPYEVPTILAQVGHGQHVEQFEAMWVRKDGQHIAVALTISPIRNPAGQVVGAATIARDITAQRAGQEALRRSEERFNKVFRASPDTIAVLRIEDGCLLDVNESWLRAFGYRRDEVVGRCIPGLALTENMGERERIVRLLREYGAVRDHEVVSQRKNGETRQFSLSVELIDLAGEECLLVMGRDITERKQAWAAQRRSDERFARVFRSSPIAIAVSRLSDTLLLEANDTWLTMVGYRWEEAIGQRLADLNLWIDLTARDQMVADLREHGTSTERELPYRHKSGEIRLGLFSFETMDVEGDVCILTMARDITESARAVAALRESESSFRLMFANNPLSMWVYDLETLRFLEVNDAAVNHYGYTRDEFLQMQITAIRPEEDIPRLRADVAQPREDLQVSEQWRHRRKDGRIIDVRIASHTLTFGGQRAVLVVAEDITERKQAEDALRRSEERFAKAFQASPMGIGISRVSDGKIIDVNEYWTQMTGYTREEAIGQRGTTLHLWASPEDRVRVIEPLQEHNVVREVETAFRRKTGEIYQASVSADIIEIEGEPCVLMLSRDITAEKQAQDALRRSEERFTRVFHASPVGIAITRQADGVFVEVNDTWLTMSGYARDEVIGQNSAHLGLWSGSEDRTRLLTTLRDQGVIHLPETRYRRRSGEIREGLLSFETIEIDGEACLLNTLQDITERKQAADALRHSEERFARMFKASPDPITLSRQRDGILLDVNDAWTRLFGYSREEAVGQSVTALGILPNEEDRTQLIARMEVEGGVHDQEVILQPRTGAPLQVSLSLEVVDIEGDRCLLAMIRDVTDRKRMEERSRTSERMSTLGQVAAGVAHEFNNVLAGIMGRLDLLTREIHDPSLTAHLRLIQQSAEDGAAVVARIGRFARTPETTMRTPLLVQELINDVINLTEPRRIMPGQFRPQVTLHTRIAPGLLIEGNPTELREVLTNLIFNATDAMPQGGQISIIAGTQGEQVTIVVQDEGIGIDPAIQARIFEPFFTTKVTGSGLGLTMVKSIIENHDGEISVHPGSSGGTRFVITLPIARPAPAPPPPAPPLPADRPARILVVDDDRRLCEILQTMLIIDGHEVVMTTTGQEAIALLDTGPFDLVCTDLGMPGMNGWEVADQVRQRAPGTPIALITGWGNQLDPADLARHQIDFVLPKPYRMAQVQEMVVQALAHGPHPPAS